VLELSMAKRTDPGSRDLSDPEISVTAIQEAHPEDVEAPPTVVTGERFGKYLLIGEIATGGMAEVFLAVHKGLEGFTKVVVIKRVLQHLSRNPDFVRMFIDEARLAARLEHPNIVRTYEFGEVAGQYYTVMEYLPGEDLFRALNRLSVSKQLMPLNMAAGIAAQLCAGLDFAHQLTDIDGRPLHLVHRDINPANVIVTYGGEVKIIDFGVAKSNANSQTVTGTIKGKIAYMPPEQVLGRNVDQRADIFSAGVVLWELLTGRPLFLGESEAATLYAVMNAPIRRPSELRPSVPSQLDAIVDRALARSPVDRYPTAEMMAADLERFMTHLPRYDSRLLAGKVEALFGSTRAEAKRSIAQTRSLARNVSLVMRLRSEVRADLVETLDGPAGGAAARHTGTRVGEIAPPRTVAGAMANSLIEAVAQPRSQRRLLIVLAIAMLACTAAGLGYALTRSEQEQEPVAPQVAQTALRIESTPPGAVVFVDGEPTGLTTPTTLTGVTAKHLQIRLERAGHASTSVELDVPAGATTTRQFALTRISGRLVISDLPKNATVIVDDEEHAAGEVIAAAAGSHMVRIVVDGETIVQQALEVAAGDQRWKLARNKLVPN
jgi:serine/threonine protein kinase